MFFHIKAAGQNNSPVYRGMPARIVEQKDQATYFEIVEVQPNDGDYNGNSWTEAF